VYGGRTCIWRDQAYFSVYSLGDDTSDVPFFEASGRWSSVRAALAKIDYHSSVVLGRLRLIGLQRLHSSRLEDYMSLVGLASRKRPFRHAHFHGEEGS